MANITIWNKGKRTWKVKDADGKNVDLAPQESVNMDEVAGLKLVAAYPRDLTTSGIAAPSFDDIKRREQSVKDREAHLDKREKELDEREKASKIDVPENIEKLVEKIAIECMLEETDEHPRGFCTSKAAEIITAFLAEQSKDKEPSDEPAKKRGRPAASKAE